jgi:hypothetical protein
MFPMSEIPQKIDLFQSDDENNLRSRTRLGTALVQDEEILGRNLGLTFQRLDPDLFYGWQKEPLPWKNEEHKGRPFMDFMLDNISLDISFDRNNNLWQSTVTNNGQRYFSDRHLKAEHALLLAYLRMLADQRSINPMSTWQHFKGDVMTVVAEAREAYPGGGSKSIGVYTIEESPSQEVELFTRPDGTFVYFSGNTIPQSNRVFYTHNGQSWTRTRSNFLSLVGSELPQSYGLLRFADVGQ